MPATWSRSIARCAVVKATSSRAASLLTPQNGFSAKRSRALSGRRDGALASEPLPPAGEQLVDALDAAERVLGLLRRAGEEVSEPLPPLASLRHAEQARVVLLARAIEEGAQVEERRGQHALGDEQQRDEQPSDAPVAVEEGVDGF